MRYFGRILFAACILVVTVAGGAVIRQQFFGKPSADICADEVRGYQESAESALNAAAQNFAKIGVSLSAETSREYIQQLSQLNPTELLAIKSCDTHCRLLERCISKSPEPSVEKACPAEYDDYKVRVTKTLALLERLHTYEADMRRAVQKAQDIEKTQEKLKEAQGTVGSSGAREAILRENLLLQQRELNAEVSTLEEVAKRIISNAEGA